MNEARVLRLLKQDSFGRVELVERGGERCIRRVACGGRWAGSRWIAHVLAQRERRALYELRGLAGVPSIVHDVECERAPSLDGLVPKHADVNLRSYVEGLPLSRAEQLPADFFERLAELVRELHARRVCHNDLHKEQNVIVGREGWPHLIDFQLASVHARGSLSFGARVRDDLRHVAKHRRRYLRFTAGSRPHEIEPLPRRTLVAAIWRRTAKPLYNFVTRRLLGTRDGEERRGIEGPWPRWTSAVGARSQSNISSPPERQEA